MWKPPRKTKLTKYVDEFGHSIQHDQTWEFWQDVNKNEGPCYEKWRYRIEEKYLSMCSDITNKLGYEFGSKYIWHPVKMVLLVRENHGFDHVNETQLGKIIGEHHYHGTWYEYAYRSSPPRVDPDTIYFELAAEHGMSCKACNRIEKYGWEDRGEFYANKKWMEHGVCPVCIGDISRKKYKEARERKIAEKIYKEKTAQENAEWIEKEQQRRIAIKEERDRRRILEKAAYEALKEMGLLDTIITQETKNDGVESRSHRSKAPVVGKIQFKRAAKG